MHKDTNGQTAPLKKRKYGWRHLLRERSWATLNIIVGVSMLANVGSLASLVPPAAFAANAGSIWTTTGSCGEPQNINEYQVGEHVFINGAGFDPADNPIAWDINSVPPSTPVASGTHSVDANGNFCFDAYTIQPGDDGVYKVTFDGNKHDNYHVNGLGDLVIHKGLDANGDGTFEGNDDAGNAAGFRWGLNSDPMTQTFGVSVVDVAVGTHSVNENTLPGYHLAGWTVGASPSLCNDLQSLNGGTPSITVTSQGVAEIILCNAKDEERVGSLTVTKTVVGGNLSPDSVILRIEPDPNGVGPVKPTNGTYTFTNLPAGIYTVTEGMTPGYAQNISDCVEVTVAADGSATCEIVNTEITVTLNAWKIVCTVEADLPNWGAVGGPNITATTAQNWVDTHPNCSFAEDWNFQWATDYPGNPGDNTGAAGAPWTTFGPTDGTGLTSTTFGVQSMKKLWVREVWQNGYIPFTYNEEGGVGSNENNVSAEMYCHTDVINYDNFDWIEDVTFGGTYNCVAWNVQVEEPRGAIHGQKFNDVNGNGVWDEDTGPMAGWTMFLDEDGDGVLDDGEQSMQTSNDQNHYGWYWFENLLPGTYSVCEVQQNGWNQTYPQNDNNNCHTITVPQGDEGDTCFNPRTLQLDVVENAVIGPMCNFGNQQQATVTVLKNVDENGDGDTTDPGDIVGATNWTWDVNAGNQNYATGSTQTVTPGSVTINEDAKEGYSFVNVVCAVNEDPFEVAQSESVTFDTFSGGNYVCTYTNQKNVTSITLDKTGPATATPGQSFTYGLTWGVTGNTAATNAIITDPLPANTTFVSADNGGTFAAGVVTWNLGTKAPGTAGTVNVTVLVNPSLTASTTLNNTGTFDTDQTPPVSDTVPTTVTVPQILGFSAELNLTKSVDKTSANRGDTLTYTLVVTNDGLGEVTNVVVTDNLPDGFVFLATNKATRTWNLGTLAAGESKTLTYKVVVGNNVPAGEHVNRAFVTADFFDPIMAQAAVTIKIPQVLGLATTGAGLMEYLTFILGLVLVSAGVVSFLKLRRRSSASA